MLAAPSWRAGVSLPPSYVPVRRGVRGRGRPRGAWGTSTRGGRSMTVQREAGFRNGIDVRVRLRREGTSRDAAFDGAWWPRGGLGPVGRPELVAALGSLGVRVERFTFPAEAWDEPPARKVAVGRRT